MVSDKDLTFLCLFKDLTFNKILSYVQRSNILFDIVQ